MKVDTAKICERYYNLQNFCDEMGISKHVLSHIMNKKTHRFMKGSKSFKVYHKLKDLGLIIEEEV